MIYGIYKINIHHTTYDRAIHSNHQEITGFLYNFSQKNGEFDKNKLN